MDQPQLLDLAQQIAKNTADIVAYISKTGQMESTYHQSSSIIKGDDSFETARVAINEAAKDLVRLINGPMIEFRSFFMTHYDLAAYQIALEMKYFKAVPVNGSISLEDLAKTVGMDEDRTARVMRHLATLKVFYEKEAGVFEHTAASALVATDEDIDATLLMQIDEMFRAASEASTCIQKAPYETNSINSPFCARHGVPCFEYYANHPAKAARFARAMAGVTRMDRQISELRDEYPWGTLGSGTVVDVGGGSGHVSMYLASQFPNLRFVVQDASINMLTQAREMLTSGLEDRITFMQHNFFHEQPVHDATAFFIRQCTHNWNDEDCIKIFRAFVPALEKCKPGTPLLINDTILPEPNTITKYQEHGLRQVDIAMFVVLGAKQRTEKEFRGLLTRADDRLEVVKVHGKHSMGLVEVQLKRTK